jgi:ParB/RepB/Spo0J family partition protein
VDNPQRRRRLLASLADTGQQVPIVVVAMEGQADRYVVIDGYKRIAALEQLGRDTVEAVVWPMSEAAAVLLDRSLRLSEHETALEVGWLLAEMEQRFGYSLEELARRLDRSVSWVRRRLALVELLPAGIQQQVREGKIAAQMAMKYLVPVARQSVEDCQRMAEIFATHPCTTREAGQLYAAWRRGSAAIRRRILEDPGLFFKTQLPEKPATETSEALMRDLEMIRAIVGRIQRRLAGGAVEELDGQQLGAARQQIERLEKQLAGIQERLLPREESHVKPSTTNGDPRTAIEGSGKARNRAGAGGIAIVGTQSSAVELHPGARGAAPRESASVSATDPGAFREVQGESRASP